MQQQEQATIAAHSCQEVDLVRFLGIARWDQDDGAFFLVGEHAETTTTRLNFLQGIAEEVLRQLKNESQEVNVQSLRRFLSRVIV